MGKVKKFLKDVFRSIIILPLTAGNGLGMNRNRNRPVHDGRISTIVLVGCVLSMVAVVLLVHNSKAKKYDIPLITIKILLIVMVFIGLLTIIILAVYNCRNKLEVATQYRLEGKSRFKIKFLWLFGIMSNVYKGFTIGASVECFSVNTTKYSQITFYFRILYSCLLIVFHFVQIVFISYFSGSLILASVTSHYGILLLLTANGAVWFYSFIQASSTLFSSTATTNLPSQRVYHCLGNTSSFDIFLDQAKPILYPAHVAFSLLSVGILLSMWSSTENPVTNETNIVELSSYIELSDGDSDSAHNDREYVPNRNRAVPRRHNPLSYYATIVIGIVFALPYILGAVLVVKSNDQSLTNTWISYKFGYKVILWIFSLVAFYKLKSECKPNLRHKPLDGNEWILFFSTFVDAMFHTFGLIAGALIIPNDDVMKTASNIVLVENIFNLLIDYYQTVFLIQANRFKKKSRNNLSWPIENTCLLLCILNIGQWLIDCFAGKEYHTATTVQKRFYLPRYWDGVMSFVFPVAVYFRFQSFMGMYSLYDKFKRL
ncbi:hypothetical protein KUTeg_009643 [Tegillarca granosa]|uniref:Otopetrin n=1 Tax=Tegillarca granosa TaxID=220873 RepID=A0ABQ9F9K3_TEGGR|nr:hypothetical protein KUTeg_009643 [Tegillarca granosa]